MLEKRRSMLIITLSIFLLYSLSNVFGIDCNSSENYPSVNQSGPLYTIPRANISIYLKCYPGKNHRKHWILFVPGSTEEVHELYSWNWMRIMDKKQWSYCTLQLPEKGLGDLQIAAEYIVYAVRNIFKKVLREKEKGLRQKTRINIIGHSVGGTIPRFSLRFWPDIRKMIYHLIAFGATHHGTILADAICSLSSCPTGVIQQRINSSFLCALNSYQETFPQIKYTNILSKFDEIVRPVKSSELKGANVNNVYIQNYCPLRIFSEHLSAGLYDYCGYYLTMKALRSRSLKNISSKKCCAKKLMPGINLTTNEFLWKVAYSAEEHIQHLLMHFGQRKDEPELRCAFRKDCIQTKTQINQIHIQ